MRDDEADLLAEILSNPDDDIPRLVYADWLEDRGDPYGDLIRVQCRLARLRADDPEQEHLKSIEQTLLSSNAHEWIEPLRAFTTATSPFERGFINELPLSADFLESREDLPPFPRTVLRVRIHPFDRRRATAQMRRIADLLGAASALDLSCNNLAASEARLLAELSRFGRLVWLHLGATRLGDKGVFLLAGSRHPRRLRWLNLRSNNIGNPGAIALSGGDLLCDVTSLTLADNRIGPGGLAALVSSKPCERLIRLNLSGNPIGDEGVEPLAHSPHLRSLRCLGLHRIGMSDSGVRWLLESPHLEGLEWLNVSGNELSRQAASRLAERFGVGVYS